MTCNISQIRRQLEEMQTLLDTYEHCHVDSVTPEEKVIVNKIKKACVEAAMNAGITRDQCAYIQGTIVPAIEKVKL